MNFVYKITNLVNKKVYIGKTSKTIEKRWNEHLRDSQKPKERKYLYDAMRKYGIDKFVVEELSRSEMNETCCKMEMFFIKRYNSTDKKFGYNKSFGGDGGAFDWSEESRKRMSQIKKGMLLTKFTKKLISDSLVGNKRMFGRKHSEETKKLMSQAAKGRIVSEETRKRMSIAFMGRGKGKKLSEEHKNTLRQLLLGNTRMKGKKYTEEQKKAIVLRQTGAKRSMETRQRMSFAAKEKWKQWKSNKIR